MSVALFGHALADSEMGRGVCIGMFLQMLEWCEMALRVGMLSQTLKWAEGLWVVGTLFMPLLLSQSQLRVRACVRGMLLHGYSTTICNYHHSPHSALHCTRSSSKLLGANCSAIFHYPEYSVNTPATSCGFTAKFITLV